MHTDPTQLGRLKIMARLAEETLNEMIEPLGVKTIIVVVPAILFAFYSVLNTWAYAKQWKRQHQQGVESGGGGGAGVGVGNRKSASQHQQQHQPLTHTYIPDRVAVHHYFVPTSSMPPSSSASSPSSPSSSAAAVRGLKNRSIPRLDRRVASSISSDDDDDDDRDEHSHYDHLHNHHRYDHDDNDNDNDVYYTTNGRPDSFVGRRRGYNQHVAPIA
jgi:hypothetical protein